MRGRPAWSVRARLRGVARAPLRRWCVLLLVLACVAHAAEPPPKDLDRRAGFDQHLGASLPMQLPLRDADGRTGTLRSFAHGKPLLLAFGYYRCPNLCDVVLHGMARSVAGLQLVPGRDFEVAFVSIDPKEGAPDAQRSRATLARRQPRAQVARWHFLTAEAPTIDALTRAAGFRYFYDPRLDQYAHAAGLLVVTPQGRVAQYFFGASWPPASLRLALVDASRGRLGGLVDRLVLLCCGYDPTTGRYSLAIGRAMQALGLAFVLACAGWLAWLRRRVRT